MGASLNRHHHDSVKYRPDIDGLRAIAVLSVFAYHLNPSMLPAGGLGVDIFFVISGYLIGGIILRESAEGRFSFLNFYERRLRRIVPALLMCVLLVLAACAALLMPADFEASALSSVAAMLSASNLYFWHTVDYFNEAAAEMPLLHTWSLGVEEQFYIVAPILLTLIARHARRVLVPVLAVALAASLALNIHQVAHAPINAFYLPQGRAWELLAGVILTQLHSNALTRRGPRELIAGIGAALLVGSLIAIRPEQGWPGVAAIPPVLGTALLLWAGQHGTSITARLLSLRPMTFVGLISYSLYLWHWPAIVFTREIILVDRFSTSAMMAIFLFAFVAAWLSWRFVEQPFRKTATMPGKPLLLWTGCGTALVLGICALIWVNKGFPSRFDSETIRLASFADSEDSANRRCILTERDALSDFPADCLSPVPGKRGILLLGDSHANMYRAALNAIPGAHVMEATYAACAPDGALTPQSAGTPCGRLIRRALGEVQKHKLDLIVISWQLKRFDAERIRAMGRELQKLGAPILLIGPSPEYSVRVPKLLAAARVRNLPDLPQTYLNRTMLWKGDAQLAPVARGFASYLSPREALCTKQACALAAGGDPLYYDRQHFNASGAQFIFRQMIEGQLTPEQRRALGLERLQH